MKVTKKLNIIMKNKIIIIVLTVLIFASCKNTYTEYHKAKNENTITAYENFIKEYPKSKYVDSANFEIVFLKTGEYPAEYYAAIEAETELTTAEKIEKALWEDVKTQDIIDSYNEFIDLYPDGNYTDSANLIISFIDKDFQCVYVDSINNQTITLDLLISETGEVEGTLTGASFDGDKTWIGSLIGFRMANWLKLNYIQTESSDDIIDETEIENNYFIDSQGLFLNENLYIINSEDTDEITEEADSKG